MTTKATLSVLVLAALAGCGMKLEDGTILEHGQRIQVRIMCPGGAEFLGWYHNGHPASRGAGLTDAEGRRIGNANRCAWVAV